jgi:membrane-bound ClpP family serine protease
MLWVSIIITIVCCVITVYAPGAWPLAAIGIAQLVVVLSFLAILPLIYGVIIVLISIVMIAYLIAKPGGG